MRVQSSLAKAEEFPLPARVCDNTNVAARSRKGKTNEDESEQPLLSFVTPGTSRGTYETAFYRVYLVYHAFDKHGAGFLFESSRSPYL